LKLISVDNTAKKIFLGLGGKKNSYGIQGYVTDERGYDELSDKKCKHLSISPQ
jgi:hypothetical protein